MHIVVAVNLFETVLCTHLLWFFAVANWGNVDVFELRITPWTGEAVSPVTGFGEHYWIRPNDPGSYSS